MRPANATASSRARLGFLLAAISSVGFGLTPICARWAYDGGSTPLTVLAFRYVAVGTVLALLLPRLGRSLALPRGYRSAGMVVGMLFVLISYGYLGAVYYIPASLAVLIFFSYPIVLAVIARLFGHERLGVAGGVAVAVAFVGLAVILGPSAGTVDGRGVLLAAMAAAASAACYLYAGRAAGGADLMTVNVQAMATAAALCLPAAWATGTFALPETPRGWVGLAGLAVVFGIGVVTYFAAIATIGALRAALLSNLEPVVTVTAALLLLGESLTPLQAAGIPLVLGAVAVLGRGGLPRDARSPLSRPD